MIVDIDKVIVKDRIRKDFGDIQELADDIKENGIINPPVINKDYELIAGERRLRALKLLGYDRIEVRMMDTKDEEHELNVEISENEVRKDFSKSERASYMKKLMEIEGEKARERQGNRNNICENSHESLRTDEIVASQFGISSNTLRKEISILDNSSALTPSDFADWDEGRLSTNKAFQKIKAELERVKKEKEDADIQIEEFKDELEEASRQIDVYRKVDGSNIKLLNSDLEKALSERNQYKQELDKIKESTPKNERNKKRLDAALCFCNKVADFIQQVGGYSWVADEIKDLPKTERQGYELAINQLRELVDRFEIKVNNIIN